MVKKHCIVSWFLIIFFGSYAYGDYLEVRRVAKIKVAPERNADVIERVESAILLELLDDGDQSSGYYHVIPPSYGPTGWIYRTFVRRHSGEIPDSQHDVTTPNPLSDPTFVPNSEQFRFAARHLRLGKPQAVYERAREGYSLAFDGRLKIPVWVQYELSRDDLVGSGNRTKFNADTSIPFGYRSEDRDYIDSGYDRGHMAPFADMKRSESVQEESFLLSNAAPQVGPGFNQRIWKKLEADIRGWVEQRGTLLIIVGPIFSVNDNKVSYSVISSRNIAVPTHFYKIVVDATDLGDIETLAFIMPNEDLSEKEYEEFLVPIDEIEAATGLDFLSKLPVDIQENVELEAADNVW